VLTDEYDELIVDAIRALPPELPTVEALRNVMRAMVDEMVATDRQRMLDRTRLMLSVPALRSRQWDQTKVTQHAILGVLAERVGRPASDFELQAFVAAVIAVWETAVLSWVEAEGKTDIVELLDRGVDFLIAGCPL